MGVNIIDRAKAEALIEEQLIKTIFQEAPKQSAFMSMAHKLPNMSSNVTRMRVLDVMPMAYWVDGDTGMKSTSDASWDNVYMEAAELAVIVPISDAVRDDASIDIYGEILPRINEAIGRRVDEAVFFGINRPARWQNDIVTLARQAGNNVSPNVSGKDYFDLIMGEDGVISKIERFGYMNKGAIASVSMRGKLRGLRDTTGQPIFKADMQGSTRYSLDGEPMYFPDNGAFQPNIAQLIIGDFSKAVYAIRQDVTVKILTEGVIQDPVSKDIVYNLAQQDMTALRVVFRMGWALPNPATNMDGERIGCPFAYLEPGTPATTYNAVFTVTTGEDEEDKTAVNGAIVDVNGSRKKVDANGKATFTLANGKYPFKVKANGYVQQSGTFVVNGAGVTEDISLVAAE